MKVIIQHEDMSSPLLELREQTVIPNVGDTLDIFYADEMRQSSLYDVKGRHFFYDTDDGLQAVLVWVTGKLPQVDKAEWDKHRAEVDKFLESIGKKNER